MPPYIPQTLEPDVRRALDAFSRCLDRGGRVVLTLAGSGVTVQVDPPDAPKV